MEPASAVDGTSSGTWATDCESEVTGRGYARYYGITVEQESQVTIDLESSEDTYLYLRRGDARSGTVLHENDDVASGNTDSQDQRDVDGGELTAGSYTIEATTYTGRWDMAGSFTLTTASRWSGVTIGRRDTATEPGVGRSCTRTDVASGNGQRDVVGG